MKIYYYSSSSGNTQRFVENYNAYDNSHEFELISEKIDYSSLNIEDFVLICPTYADGKGRGSVPKAVIKFLNNKNVRDKIVGVIGTGNTNFGEKYGLSANIISQKCGVPILYKFELSGTSSDIKNISKGLIEFGKLHDKKQY